MMRVDIMVYRSRLLALSATPAAVAAAYWFQYCHVLYCAKTCLVWLDDAVSNLLKVTM